VIPNLPFLLIGLGIAVAVILAVAYYYDRCLSNDGHGKRNNVRPTRPAVERSGRAPSRPRPALGSPHVTSGDPAWSRPDVDTRDPDDEPPQLVRPYVLHAEARRAALSRSVEQSNAASSRLAKAAA
jgi:hypothetical protein